MSDDILRGGTKRQGHLPHHEDMDETKIATRPPGNPFDIRDNRVMVSIGPLSDKKHCTYSCPFCYVRAGFLSYVKASLEALREYLASKSGQYDIIYISGDTDSFAPPRTSEGIALIRLCCTFGVDVLFTTRAVFSPSQLAEVIALSRELSLRGNLLFGCGSVIQLRHHHLEPPPIASPLARIAQLKAYKESGIVSVLAMRPFLPIVPTEEYLEIIDHTANSVDVILGEVWYSDQGGVLDHGVFGADAIPNYSYVLKHMPFDENKAIWKVYAPQEKELSIRNRCAELQIPFFMRSRPAIEHVRHLPR